MGTFTDQFALIWDGTQKCWKVAAVTTASGGTVTSSGTPTAGKISKFTATTDITVATATDLGNVRYATGGGTAQAQTVTLSPAIASLTSGLEVCWKPIAANTATDPTLAISGLTATVIKKAGDASLVANDLSAEGVSCVIYDGTEFQLQNPQTAITGAGATPALDNLSGVSINTALLAQTGVDLGSTAKPFRNMYLFGSGTYGTNYFLFTGTPTGTRTITVPDVSSTLAILGANVFTGRQDSTGASSTAPAKTGTSLPGTCVVGELYFKSDATAGQNIYECQSTNTWTQQLNSGGGASALSAVTAATGANTISSGDNSQTWQWAITTADKKAFNFTESAASTATGAPILFNINTLSTSTAIPFQATSNGIGWKVATDGSLASVGATASGKQTFSGITSGSFSIKAADVAGTPADILFPTATAAASSVLESDGASPQVTSWRATSGTGNIARVNATMTGLWNGTVITGTYGGSGVNNGSFTHTLAGNVTFTGAFNPTFSIPSSSTWTFPSGNSSLARIDGTNAGTSAVTYDLSASTVSNAFKVPVKASVTTSANGAIGYDSTTDMLHAAQGAADAYIPQATVAPANNDCAKWTVSGSKYKLDTAGAACGSGSGSGAGGWLFSTTGSTTVTAATATTLIGTVNGSTTVAANTYTAGAIQELLAQGYYTGFSTRTLTIDLKVGGTTRLTTGAIAVPVATNGVWRLLCGITTRTAGASGTQIGNCIFEATGASLTAPGEGPMQTASTWTVDTTGTLAIDLQATWDSTTGSPTITSTNVAAWIPGAPVTSVAGATGATLPDFTYSSNTLTAAAAGKLDMTAATNHNAFKVPLIANIATTQTGAIGYDLNNDMLHASQAGADAKVPQFTITPVNNDCTNWAVSGNTYKLGTTGQRCGSFATGSTGTITSGKLACVTSSNTMGNCTALPPNNVLGVFNSSTTYVTSGIATVALDATVSVTFGDILCASSTGAGQAHANGTTACSNGQWVGIVTTTAASVSSATASLRLQ